MCTINQLQKGRSSTLQIKQLSNYQLLSIIKQQSKQERNKHSNQWLQSRTSKPPPHSIRR